MLPHISAPAQPSIHFNPPPNPAPNPIQPSNIPPMPSQIQPSTVTKSRKLDIKNPYNEVGKIVKIHPKYYDVLDNAKKQIEQSLHSMDLKNASKARENLQKAYELLDTLED